MLLKTLTQLQLQKKLISIDRDCHNEELTGHLVTFNTEFVLFKEITEDGRYDGFSLFETDQIEQLFWGNREHDAIAALIPEGEKVKTPKLTANTFEEAIIELNALYSSLCIFEHHDEDSFAVANITEYDHEWLSLKTYGPKRSLSAMEKLIKLENVSRVSVDSLYQNNIVALHDKGL